MRSSPGPFIRNYVRHQKQAGATPETNPSMVAWDDLPDDLKESNRQQADHIEVKLAAIGCGIQSLTDWKSASFERLPEEVKTVFDVELLARMEHERWCEERRRLGWTFASGPKDLKKKTSPYLVPWEELPPEIQDLDRNTVLGLPSFLAQAGFQIYPEDLRSRRESACDASFGFATMAPTAGSDSPMKEE